MIRLFGPMARRRTSENLLTRDPLNGSPRFALLVLFAINVVNFFDRQIAAALAEPIRQEFALGDAALGSLSTAFTLLYAAAGLPFGRLADRLHRPRLLGAGVAAWSVMTAASGFAPTFGALLLARLGVGVGEAVCAPAANSLISDLVPADRRARALSVFMLGLPVGIFLSYALSGALATRFGWRAAFYFAAVPGLALALVVARLREPRPAAVAGAGAHGVTGLAAFREVLRRPTLWWITASGALHNFNLYAVNAFLPAHLSRTHGLPLSDATFISAVILGGVGVLALIGGGILADRVTRRGVERRPLVPAFALLAAAPLALIALTAGRLSIFIVFMAVSVMLMQVYYAAIYACILDVVPAHLRGTALAVYFFAMYVLGASFGPLVMGALSDRFARGAMAAAGESVLAESHRAAGLQQAFGIVPWLALVVAATLFAAARTTRRDAVER